MPLVLLYVGDREAVRSTPKQQPRRSRRDAAAHRRFQGQARRGRGTSGSRRRPERPRQVRNDSAACRCDAGQHGVGEAPDRSGGNRRGSDVPRENAGRCR